MIKVKRIYEATCEQDGYRVLVDRLWPRGVSKEKANIDSWLKDISPSHELRKWFNHEPAKWEETQDRYAKELAERQEIVTELRSLEAKHKTLTLLYAAKDTEHNNAVALQKYLQTR